MSAAVGFLLGLLVMGVLALFVISWLLSRLAEADRRNLAWQDECRHACEKQRVIDEQTQQIGALYDSVDRLAHLYLTKTDNAKGAA